MLASWPNIIPLKQANQASFAYYAFAFDDGEGVVAARQRHRLGCAARPFDFYLIDLRRCAQSKMQSLIVLRSVACAADRILSLPQLARRDINNRADGVSRTLLRRVAD